MLLLRFVGVVAAAVAVAVLLLAGAGALAFVFRLDDSLVVVCTLISDPLCDSCWFSIVCGGRACINTRTIRVCSNLSGMNEEPCLCQSLNKINPVIASPWLPWVQWSMSPIPTYLATAVIEWVLGVSKRREEEGKKWEGTSERERERERALSYLSVTVVWVHATRMWCPVCLG